MNQLSPDFGVYGEGEKALKQIIEKLRNNQDVFSIEGLVYQKEEKIIINERSGHINSLNLRINKNTIGYYWDESGMLNIQTKRGCPYHCIYCSYPVIEGTKVRTLDQNEIIDTLKDLNENHKISYVFFTDSVFNLSKEYNQQLAEKIIEADLNMKWGAYFSPHNLDLETLKLYSKAGLKHIEFGTESLSDKTLKNYGKHFTVEDVVEVSKNCQEAGIYFAHFLILAGFGETNETLNETFENSKRINNSVFFPFIGMRIYPGTKLQKLAIEEGVISESDNLIKPQYYIAKNVNLDTLKEKALKTGKNWVFPDEDLPEVIKIMRKKKRKGPLWHLIR
jgi:radical SAM superfamily enzyme YgiQ (UPF0313 family)